MRLQAIQNRIDTYRQLTNSSAFFSQYILCSGCHNNDFCPSWSNSDFYARVSILGKFTGQELIEFGLEDTVCDKLKNKIFTKYQSVVQRNFDKKWLTVR